MRAATQIQERNLIRFGTAAGALIGEGFTLDNARRLCQAPPMTSCAPAASRMRCFIGYDRRFLGQEAAEAAAEVFAGNNIPVQLLREAAPTPLVTYATAQHQFAYGLMFTASQSRAMERPCSLRQRRLVAAGRPDTRIADRANALRRRGRQSRARPGAGERHGADGGLHQRLRRCRRSAHIDLNAIQMQGCAWPWIPCTAWAR
ncbi:MAG: hypothetical protein R2851_17775 [Caldilineaceae bacterium]